MVNLKQPALIVLWNGNYSVWVMGKEATVMSSNSIKPVADKSIYGKVVKKSRNWTEEMGE